ncbi:MAG: hypothetical protein WCY68_05405 [Desulfuromonadales bacterium]
MTRTLVRTLCLTLILTALVACGKKGPVRPKLLPTPAAPAPVAVEQRGERFLLSWDIPRKNQDGSSLTDLRGFEIARMRYRPAEDCPECRQDFVPVRSVDLEYLQGVRRSGERLFWWDDQPQPEFGYIYRVTPVTIAGRAGRPAEAGRLYAPPPSPPQQQQGTGHDRLVRLDWQPPADGTGDLLGFYIYRWQPDTPVPLQPINERPLAETFYQDFAVENGRTYLYSVATATGIDGDPVQSTLPEPVKVTPEAGK